MKKNLFAITAIVFALVLSAFSLRPVNDKGQPNPTWGKTDIYGVLLSNPQYFEGTIEAARQQYSCPTDGEVFCAREVDASGQVKPGGASIKRD